MDDHIVADVVPARPIASPNAPATEPDGSISGTPNGLRSSPPPARQDVAMYIDRPDGGVDDIGAKSDSEAETIVLPGKDGHSPSKRRKSIKHEDKSDDEEMKDAPDIGADSIDGSVIQQRGREREAPRLGRNASELTATSSLGKRKRPKHGNGNGTLNIKDDALPGNSSGLSSVPTSPVTTTRSSLSKLAASDSEVSKSPSPRSRSRSAVRDKAKSVDRVLARGKQYGSADEDEGESRRFGRQRSSGLDHKASHASSRLDGDSNPRKRTRSVSPHSRGHRRSISTQLPSKSSRGLSHKKKRVPAPLQSTEYHSDESSASGNSHPRSSRVRNLTAPVTGDLAMSPAKMTAHRKITNSSGQTHLAVACSRGKLEVVKQRYEERPEDLNLPDNALNTPLHIASLEGFIDIVQFLLDTGNCELDSQNIEKDTPLHDAIDNKNLEVVKLLLKAGANPSKPNQAGNEPLDLVNLHENDDDNDEETIAIMKEMRKAIITARERFASQKQRDSEGPQMHGNMPHAKGSPRQSPPMQNYDAQGLGVAKPKTARSMKTAENGLYQPLNLDTLQVAAQNEDIATVSRILLVKPNIDDPKTLYNAAKGGHDAVISLLFALGNFNPDPDAVDGAPADQPTPILAAIGKDNHLEVIKLFLANSDFNPTKRFKGEYYHEIARRRGGPKWQEEEELLKKAVEVYQKSHKNSPGKVRSPGLRRDGRDGDRDAKKAARRDEPRPHKRTPSSPTIKEPESNKTQHHKSSSITQSKDGTKRGPGRPRKEDSTALNATSDRETSPLGPPKQKSQSRKSESDVAVTSENEPVKTRKRLISRKELNREETLEKQRRASIASNTSGVSVKDKKERHHVDTKLDKSEGKSSANIPRVPKPSSHSDRDSNSERHSEKDRARSIKREDSKDRVSAIRGESPIKRPRKSETPPRLGISDISTPGDRSSDIPQKRRKLEAESSMHKDTPSSSPEHRTMNAKSTLSRENSVRQGSDAKSKAPRTQKHGDSLDVPKDTTSSDKSSLNRPLNSGSSDAASKKSKAFAERISNGAGEKVSSMTKQDDEDGLKQAQIRREKRELEATRQREAEEEKQRIEQEKVEQAKQARLAREKAALEEEEKKTHEEMERRERQRIEDAEAQQRAMEEQRARYLEQERLKKEEQERRQALRMEQVRIERLRIEKERTEERLSKLPPLLRWFDQAADPKTPDVARLFRKIVGYRYDTINPEAIGQAAGREQWMLNTDAAILLGEKDLQLSRYPAWERISLSLPQKRGVWNTCNGLFLLLDGSPELRELRKQFSQKGQAMHEIVDKNKSLFLNLQLFFIKVTEFMFVVPSFPHLRGVEMAVIYKELQIPQASLEVGKILNESRWKQDFPDQLWTPLPTYYINGVLVRQGEMKSTAMLKEPPPLDRFPRREGITRVYPGEPDYEEICRKQNLHHLIPDCQTSPVSAIHPTSQQNQSRNNSEQINGITPPRSDKSINGGSPHPDASTTEHLPNGTG